MVAFARLASYFLLLSQKKVTKEKATPYRLIPVQLSSMGVNRELTSFKQPLAESSHAAEQHRHGSRGLKVKSIEISRLISSFYQTSSFRRKSESSGFSAMKLSHWIPCRARNDINLFEMMSVYNFSINFCLNVLSACIYLQRRLE